MAATLLGMYAASAVVARGLWGFLAERFQIRSCIMFQSLAYAVAIFALLLVPGGVLLIINLLLLGLTAGGFAQLNSQAWADYWGREVVGSVFGYASAAQALAGASSVLFMGWVFDTFGSYHAALALFSTLCVVAAGAWYLARPPSSPILTTAPT